MSNEEKMSRIELAARAYVQAQVNFHALTVMHKHVLDPRDFIANAKRRQEQSNLWRECERTFIELAELCPEETGAE